MSVYLLAAYAVFWALTFVLVFSILIRQQRLEQQIAALQARLDQEAETRPESHN